MDYKILKEVSLKNFSLTGKTKHYLGNTEIPKPSFLQITKYEEDSGYYLFYLNDDKEELTDTYHDSIEKAYEQAKFEFNVQINDWYEVGSE